ncbi:MULTISPECIES: ABC transporter permease [unclassified Sphingomonas]|jgi:ABC-2 type transport system permease protein|uniref:ABC transporter permease n=1 Tax=unclassified Sphingomonas TaxID=196159 RepID=UPI000E10AE77|nr:ABC transporter permease [Sphingomonas sp. FARSPH]AXJ95740.1 sugar ABC transporter permease [Sphingomonas sp. FARSPH]
MNLNGIWAIYRFEMARALRTLWQSLITPVLLTSLNFIIFGGALGGRIQEVGGVPYGSFLVPGLIMSSLLVQSVSNASIGIYFPKFTGTVFELLSAPISAMEMVIGFVGAATTKSVAIGLVILATATAFVTVHIDHPFAMAALLILTSLAFSLFGFIIGIWAKNFEQLNFVPTLVVTPLTFLGGVFYSIDMLPQPWRTVTLFNPVVYLVSAFRWSFFGTGDVPVLISLGVTAGFLLLCLGVVGWIFRTGWRLKN